MSKAIVIFVLLCTLGVVGLGFMAVSAKKDARKRLGLRYPSGELVNGLPFRGQHPHPLDGTLRLFLTKEHAVVDKHQTSLSVTGQTRLEWVWKTKPPRFAVLDVRGIVMIWEIQGEKMVCVEGQENLAPDPYETHPGSQ